MDSLGMGAGIGQGLQSAVSTYLQTQGMLQEQAIKKRLANAQSVDAYTKLFQTGGRSTANNMAKSLGLPGTDSSSTEQAQGMIQAPESGMIQIPPPANAEQGMIQGGGSSDQASVDPKAQAAGQYAKAVNAAYDLPESARGPLLKSAGDTYAIAADPVAKQGYEKGQTDLKNAKLAPAMELKRQYEGLDSTTNLKKIGTAVSKSMDADLSSPLGQKTLVYNLMVAENPGSVATEGKLDDVRQASPSLFQHYADKVSQASTGELSEPTKNDMLRTIYKSYAGAREAQKDDQNDYADKAKRQGFDPNFVTNTSLFNRLDGQVSKRLKTLGPYQSSVSELANSSPAAQGVMNAVSSGGKGLLGGLKSLASGLLPSQNTVATESQDSMGPHGPAVTQNGHTYKWNPSTKKYEF